MRSGRDGIGLALMRLEHLDKAAGTGQPFTAGAARLIPTSRLGGVLGGGQARARWLPIAPRTPIR